ncbi:MAG TPA: adenylate cyclase [Firmicutes bacterium]|nr:adenylate cyclase [Bacillota bacterium]
MYDVMDTIWVLIGTLLVFFMQAGFTLVETGFTRAKNAGNIIMKNLMDYSLGTLVFWLIGFGLMFNAGNGFVGGLDLFVQNDYSTTIPTAGFLMFQTVFCATAATIVSGAVAERTKFISYIIVSVILSGLIYPISGHWIWGGGWLSQIGFHDFAGSTAVHLVGGVGALVGAKMVGPRIGKYNSDGKPNAIPGHNLTLGALGVFILWFAWFGFNGGSTLAASDDASLNAITSIFITTNLAAVSGVVTTMIITWWRYKKPDVSMSLNGALGGLVAITAGCDVVSPFGATAIGIIAGFVIVFGIEWVDKKLKIDDPVGAVGVHFFCGAVGTLLTGVFALENGLLYGGGVDLLLIQLIGVVAVILWASGTMITVFYVIKKTLGLRVTEAEELVGLDLEEHGIISSYADFMMVPNHCASNEIQPSVTEQATETKPSTKVHHDHAKMSNVVIITRLSHFEQLKAALVEIGITGMTVTQVLGFGMQKGATDFYRGIPLNVQLHPKVKVELTVSKIPVERVIAVAKDVLRTGNVGDGKVFVYDVEKVVKIRTGEMNYDALQDEV